MYHEEWPIGIAAADSFLLSFEMMLSILLKLLKLLFYVLVIRHKIIADKTLYSFLFFFRFKV